MNDKELIKALEYCLKSNPLAPCSECPHSVGCKPLLMAEALELIKQQRAEVLEYRRLQADFIQALIDKVKPTLFGD